MQTTVQWQKTGQWVSGNRREGRNELQRDMTKLNGRQGNLSWLWWQFHGYLHYVKAEGTLYFQYMQLTALQLYLSEGIKMI